MEDRNEMKAACDARRSPALHRLLRAGAGQESGGYSSPPCYAHEIAPGYFGELPVMSAEEIVRFLNTLLEVERAGAKLVAAIVSEHEPNTRAWKRLAAVQGDEAKNCAILIDLIERMSGTASAATDDFLRIALAVPGKAARLEFLNRGQSWVACRIHEALPYMEQGFVRGPLFAMQESHLLNIEACEELAQTLEAGWQPR